MSFPPLYYGNRFSNFSQHFDTKNIIKFVKTYRMKLQSVNNLKFVKIPVKNTSILEQFYTFNYFFQQLNNICPFCPRLHMFGTICRRKVCKGSLITFLQTDFVETCGRQVKDIKQRTFFEQSTPLLKLPSLLIRKQKVYNLVRRKMTSNERLLPKKKTC